jgi:hypothetical protein
VGRDSIGSIVWGVSFALLSLADAVADGTAVLEATFPTCTLKVIVELRAELESTLKENVWRRRKPKGRGTKARRKEQQ